MDLLFSKLVGRRRLLLAFLASGLFATGAAAGDSQHDFLLMPSVDSFNTFNESEPVVDDSFVRPSLSTLYSYSGGRFRFLGEYLWSSTESELERLQFGWRAGRNTMWWLGRFHTASKFWTTEYHHGQFMQTSITRPSIEEWEDDSGPIPSHITGITMEHTQPGAGNTAWAMGLSFGLGPEFRKDELSPFDILNPDSGHGLSFNGRVAFQPDVFSENQFGLILGWNDINVDPASDPQLADLDDIQQITVGVFADWRLADWRILGSLVHFENDLRYTGDVISDEFLAGYLQAELKASARWTAFGRIDYSSAEDNSPYLMLLPDFVPHRHMIGLRWDLVPQHALTMEIADSSTQGVESMHQHFKEIRFQWSAVFP